MAKLTTKDLQSVFRTADSKFQLFTSLKLCLPPFVALIFIGYMFSIFTDMVYIFFKSTGIPANEQMREAFTDYLVGANIDYITYTAVFFIALFIIGSYLSNLMLRSFRMVETFCIETAKDPSTEFHADIISGKKLVLEFSKVFFEFLNTSRKQNRIKPQEIEDKFEDINAPVIDQVFYLQYILIVLIITLLSSFGVYAFTSAINETLTEMAFHFLQSDGSQQLTIYFTSQMEILNSIRIISISIMVLLYILISKNLVNKVDGVSYHFFRVMREVLWGNYTARVRLRADDPGKEAAITFNSLMDEILPKGKNLKRKPTFDEQTNSEMTSTPPTFDTMTKQDGPPPVTDEIKKAEAGIQVITPEGFKVKGLTKAEALDLIKFAEAQKNKQT